MTAPEEREFFTEYGQFDPWAVLGVQSGGYSSAVDEAVLAVIRQIRDFRPIFMTTIASNLGVPEEFVELVQYILCSGDFASYGTSPRGCWLTSKGERFLALWEQWPDGYRPWELETEEPAPRCPAAEVDFSGDAIHNWFALTYASYLTIPRSVLQSMPGAWQVKFVGLLDELGATCQAHGVTLPETKITAVDAQGREIDDPLADYERGRRRLWENENGH